MLKRKAFRDVKQNFSSFFTIFLMVFLGVFVFAGIHAYMDGMNDSGQRFYEENNLQDIWVAGDSLTEEDFKTFKDIEGIDDAERALVLRCDLKEYKDVVIETNIIESNDISKMYIVEGEGFNPDKKGIWFDSYLADYLGIKVGDRLNLSYAGLEVEGEVLGLVNTPDHVYFIKDASAIFPTHDNYGFAYVSKETLPKMFSDNMIFTNFYATVKEDADIEAVKALIQAKIKNATAVTDRNANISVETYQSEVNEGKSYSVIFTALFMLIAVLSVVTTMSRFVRKQRTQIGTLKALGINRKKIIRHYVGFGFYISLIASLLGLFLGSIFIGNMFINMEAEYFEVPNMKCTIIPVVYFVAIGVVVVITVATYLTCKNILKEPAAQALRLEVPKVKVGSIKQNNGLLSKASVAVRWNVRDIKRNKGRTITAIVGIVGCTMLVVCALGMKNTMNFFIETQFETLYQFDYKLELEAGISEDRIDELTDKYGDKTSQTLIVEATSQDGKKSTEQIIINDAKDLLRNINHNCSYKELGDDGVYLSEKLIKVLGYKVGDELTWSVYGDDKTYKTKIAGTVREPQAQIITMTKAYAQKIGISYKADTIYTNKDLSNVKSIEGVELIQDKQQLEEGMLKMLNMMNMVIAVLIIVSIILAFVIIYNLGILSFTEKQYQFATMKVLGFRSKRIKNIYIMQNIWISIFAIILGLPCGYALTSVIFAMALGDNYDMIIHIVPSTYLISAVGALAVSYLINALLATKIKNIDMVTSLKANE